MSLFRNASVAKSLFKKGSASERFARLASFHGLPAKCSQLYELRTICSTSGQQTHTSHVVNQEAVRKLWASNFPSVRLQQIQKYGISASICSVFFATLEDGRKVAVKVQHPKIRETVLSDLRALSLVTKATGLIKRNFQHSSFNGEIADNLLNELDYTREAEDTAKFKRLFKNDEGLVIPTPYRDVSNSHILTLSYIEGRPLKALGSLPRSSRESLAASLLRFIVNSIFQHGVLHADPNLGNFLICRGENVPKLGVLDFGCCKTFTKHEVLSLRNVADGAYGSSGNDALHYLGELGFALDTLAPIRDKLPAALDLLALPFRTPGPFSLREWDLKRRLKSILAEGIWNFRLAGPPHLIWLIRSFFGTVSLLGLSGVDVSWHALLERAKQQSTLLHADGLLQHSRPSTTVSAAASTRRKVEFLVRENGVEKARVRMPADILTRIEEAIPPHLSSSLQARDISPAQVIEEWRLRGEPVGVIFSLNDGGREIKISLLP